MSFRVYPLVLILAATRIVHCQNRFCYTCTGVGLDPCALFTDQHWEYCRPGAVGCGMAAGALPDKKGAITVERICLYENPVQYCKRIKAMVHSESETDYYCWTCQSNGCNNRNLSSIINRLEPGPVTVNANPIIPTKNPCRKK
ncbi:hypothetical protein WA026_021378 [Henosepilachna vigintioctopunctata]|uniref:Uncharacterized protein n=1 Tax=Henosepilachna vigintioctopunctata TaxID=420089 RepID=A0AAW1TS29_9CUCU